MTRTNEGAFETVIEAHLLGNDNVAVEERGSTYGEPFARWPSEDSWEQEVFRLQAMNSVTYSIAGSSSVDALKGLAMRYTVISCAITSRSQGGQIGDM